MYRLKVGMNAESKLAPDPLPNPINTPHTTPPPDPPVPFSSVPLLRLFVCLGVCECGCDSDCYRRDEFLYMFLKSVKSNYDIFEDYGQNDSFLSFIQ